MSLQIPIKTYARHPMYYSWRNMKKRCNNPSHPGSERYLGRGITYDPKWETFSGFKEDMESTFTKGLSIDRIDNNGNYCKDNCRWATAEEQANNRSNNVYFTIDGKKKTLTQWAKIYGVNRQTAFVRLGYGWDINKILSGVDYRG